MHEQLFYVDDKKHGECKEFHDPDQLKSIYYCVNGKMHGEFKSFWSNGATFRHCFYKDNKLHGEFRIWNLWKETCEHCFYIDNKIVSFKEIPKPSDPPTPEDRLYFLMKYDLQLLPVENLC